MTIPSTGGTWAAAGLADVDSRLLQRGGVVSVLIRDYRGAATNMSPAGFSPFAADGTPRQDLLAGKLVNGTFTMTVGTNLGWWRLGAFQERNGPQKRPNTRKDDYMILQSNWPYDSDLVSEGEDVRLTPVDTLAPFLKRIRMNLPLSDDTGASVVETFGVADYGIGKPTEAEQVERQLLLLRKRDKGGGTVYSATGYALVKLNDIGDARMSKTDADAPELTFGALPDPYFVDKNSVPIIKYEWETGSGWTRLGGGS